jgi:hypothetical protein
MRIYFYALTKHTLLTLGFQKCTKNKKELKYLTCKQIFVSKFEINRVIG